MKNLKCLNCQVENSAQKWEEETGKYYKNITTVEDVDNGRMAGIVLVCPSCQKEFSYDKKEGLYIYG